MLHPAPATGDSNYYGGSENYYDQDVIGEPFWFGKAAEAMGLRGTVNAADFDRLMAGRLPDGTVLGRGQGDKREHQSGWDLTFSAPKSVSIMALVGGDKRLIEAVNEAAKEALGWIEENAAKSRFSDGEKVTSRLTGNLAVAMYPHDLSRAQEPQLHVHSVVMNATRGPNGEWRSLDSRFLYWMAKQGGLRFQESLALKVRGIGHEIVVNTKQGTFELAHIPRSVNDSFSSRSKQVLDGLAKRGLTRETATKQETRQIAVESRGPKEKNVDRAALGTAWQQVIREHGIDLKGTLSGAGAISPSNPEAGIAANMPEKALDAVRSAARALVERQFAFSHYRLVDKAATFATGHADRPAIQNAVTVLENEGFLKAREVDDHNRAAGEHIRVQGWTTAEAVAIDQDLKDRARSGRGSRRSVAGLFMANDVVRNLENEQRDWTSQHSTALHGALTSRDKTLSLEGSMEAHADRELAKTYMETARRRGLNVDIMAPAAGAASALSRILEKPVATVAEHLAQQWKPITPQRSPVERMLTRPFRFIAPPSAPERVWIVAEANHLRPKAAQDLLKSADRKNARVIFITEDARGPSSAALDQLRYGGMRHYKLPTAPAQDRNQMYLAVAALQRGEPAAALDHIVSA
ncbi:MAG: MobF family relaxase, partial [Geminicoccaceae bacterium]